MPFKLRKIKFEPSEKISQNFDCTHLHKNFKKFRLDYFSTPNQILSIFHQFNSLTWLKIHFTLFYRAIHKLRRQVRGQGGFAKCLWLSTWGEGESSACLHRQIRALYIPIYDQESSEYSNFNLRFGSSQNCETGLIFMSNTEIQSKYEKLEFHDLFNRSMEIVFLKNSKMGHLKAP